MLIRHIATQRENSPNLQNPITTCRLLVRPITDSLPNDANPPHPPTLGCPLRKLPPHSAYRCQISRSQSADSLRVNVQYDLLTISNWRSLKLQKMSHIVCTIYTNVVYGGRGGAEFGGWFNTVISRIKCLAMRAVNGAAFFARKKLYMMTMTLGQ